MRTAVEEDLLHTLMELDKAVKAIKAIPGKPNLLPLFSRIDRLVEELPKNTDPQLLHYLHKKSYEKARLYLEGRDVENQQGSCGR
ncbi:MAG TPA: hypothetical protein VN625_10675 [Desulfuromonadaceae bacterium]|nr:hypothetical protein [Desulfuromonadaceae bacterium]